jgi:ribose 5-phosphate isomerase A
MSEQAKIKAAEAALDYVQDGMRLGLGTGSTAAHFVRLLGARVKQGLRIVGTPTSEATRKLAEEVGVPIKDLDSIGGVDLTIDGTDEIDPRFRLIKGGGGALFREKMVASSGPAMLVIADASKAVETLGAFPLPVEVSRFGFSLTAGRLYKVLKQTKCEGYEITQRQGGDGKPFITDGGNYILDAHCKRIGEPDLLADALNQVVGVLEHGLFIGLASTLILASDRGVEIRER